MKITETISMTKTGDNFFLVNDGYKAVITPSDTSYLHFVNLYNALRLDKTNREANFNTIVKDSTVEPIKAWVGCLVEDLAECETVEEERDVLLDGLNNLINFFTEFDFEPNFRFVNTLSHKISKSQNDAKDYIANYFSLMDNSYKNEICAKMKSKEFGNILKDIKSSGKPKDTINTRFKIYYGSAGCGKTTLAQTESDNRCIVCNASMLPSDLMEDFVFVEGKPSFKPSELWNCMEKGLPIVLDEINLLPFDSLRFLQGVLDGKKEFEYKGNKVTINDGFCVIGTMNLTIGGMSYGLPEPLVDRCGEIKKFTLTADMLASAIR